MNKMRLKFSGEIFALLFLRRNSGIRTGPTTTCVSNYNHSIISCFFVNFSTNLGRREDDPKFGFSHIAAYNLDDALYKFHDMLRRKPCVIEFNKLLRGVVKMKQYSVALSMFHEMRRSRRCPADEYTMNIVVDCYCLLNKVDYGFAVLGNFIKLGYEPDTTTCATLLKGLFLVGKVSEADEVTMINDLCKAGCTLSALNLAYTTVIDSCCKNRMVDDAIQLFQKMLENGISPSVATCDSLVKELCDSDRCHEAKNLLDNMVIHDVSLDVVTCNILVDAFCKQGETACAEDVLITMVQRNISPDTITYRAMLDGYILGGEIEKAKKLFYCMKNKCIQPSIVTHNRYCKKKGDVDEAWQLFHEIPRVGLEYQTYTYNTMLQGLFHAGKFATGWKLFNEMERQQLDDSLTHDIMSMMDVFMET